jgi:6-phosphogluconate dehydrogenase
MVNPGWKADFARAESPLDRQLLVCKPWYLIVLQTNRHLCPTSVEAISGSSAPQSARAMTTEDVPIAFIGLGEMGAPMASNLIEARVGPVMLYNRTQSKAQAVAATADPALGVKIATTLEEAVSPGCVALTILSNDAALLAVSEVVMGRMRGGVFVSMSTVSPETSRELAQRFAEAGVGFVTAPVFGRPDAAAGKKLWVVTSGAREAKERVQPMLRAVGQGVHDFGEVRRWWVQGRFSHDGNDDA